MTILLPTPELWLKPVLLLSTESMNLTVPAQLAGVSRDTVQRSIHMLSDDGKVIRWPGLGWYVSESGSKGLERGAGI